MKMPQKPNSSNMPLGPATATDDLASDIIAFLASEPDYLSTFFEESGLDPNALRAAASNGSLEGGLIDYLLANDRLLVAFAIHLGRTPESVARTLAQQRDVSGAGG